MQRSVHVTAKVDLLLWYSFVFEIRKRTLEPAFGMKKKCDYFHLLQNTKNFDEIASRDQSEMKLKINMDVSSMGCLGRFFFSLSLLLVSFLFHT